MGKAKLELEPKDTTLIAVCLTHLASRVPAIAEDSLEVLEVIMEQYKSGQTFTLRIGLKESTVLLAAITLTGSDFVELFDKCHTLVHKWDVGDINPWEEKPEMVPAICIEISRSLSLCRKRTESINKMGLNPN